LPPASRIPLNVSFIIISPFVLYDSEKSFVEGFIHVYLNPTSNLRKNL